MSFYMNPFTSEYIGNMVLADRKQVLEFKCPSNWGRGDDFVIAWIASPYDLTGNLNLNFMVAIDNDFRNWVELTFTMAPGDFSAGVSAATAIEIATALNAKASFAAYFTASAVDPPLFSDGTPHLKIKQNYSTSRMKFYVKNDSSEQVLRFNARAGVAELPSYFARHTVANLPNFVDGMGAIIALDAAADAADQLVIDNAVDSRGSPSQYVHTTVQDDWELLKGKSGAFNCQIITVVADLITEIIEFQTGAKVGDLARKIKYVYTPGNKNPDFIAETPFVLTSTQISYAKSNI